MRSTLRTRLAVLWAPALLLAAWTACAWARWPSPRAIPSPGAVAACAARELTGQVVWLDLGATMLRVAIGVGIAAVVGGALGLVLGIARRTWRASEPSVEFLRSIPPILTFPLFLLALGYGESARIATIVFGTTGIVLLHVASGVARAPRERREAVQLAGLRGLDAVVQLHGREALPGFLLGIRIALAAGLVIAVVTEMLIGARHGLGARALDAQLSYRADELWFVILLAGVMGMALSGLIAALERRVVRWTAS